MILLPVCTPVITVLALWQFVGMWNSYFDAMIYLNSASKQPLQLVLRSILIQNQQSQDMMGDLDTISERIMLAETIKYALIIVSTLPMMVLYPMLQRYFEKGVMVGAVKG